MISSRTSPGAAVARRAGSTAPSTGASGRVRALAIGLDEAEYRAVAPLVAEQVDVDRFPSPRGALDLIVPMSVDLLIVRYPLADMRLPEFLRRLRCPDAHSSRCSLVLVAGAEHVEAARSFLGRGANRVVTLEQPESDLFAAVTDLLRVAPRKTARFLAQLHAGSGRHMDYVMGEVRNTSATGALLETERKLPCGAEVRFHFSLPTGAIVGIGEVVRHTETSHEDVDGIALRFLSFDGDSQRAFLEFLGDAG